MAVPVSAGMVHAQAGRSRESLPRIMDAERIRFELDMRLSGFPLQFASQAHTLPAFREHLAEAQKLLNATPASR
jgi:hypothetical protein